MLDKDITRPTFVSDFLVAELGSRVAVGACGTILAQLGATVVVVEGRVIPISHLRSYASS